MGTYKIHIFGFGMNSINSINISYIPYEEMTYLSGKISILKNAHYVSSYSNEDTHP